MRVVARAPSTHKPTRPLAPTHPPTHPPTRQLLRVHHAGVGQGSHVGALLQQRLGSALQHLHACTSASKPSPCAERVICAPRSASAWTRLDPSPPLQAQARGSAAHARAHAPPQNSPRRGTGCLQPAGARAAPPSRAGGLSLPPGAPPAPPGQKEWVRGCGGGRAGGQARAARAGCPAHVPPCTLPVLRNPSLCLPRDPRSESSPHLAPLLLCILSLSEVAPLVLRAGGRRAAPNRGALMEHAQRRRGLCTPAISAQRACDTHRALHSAFH